MKKYILGFLLIGLLCLPACKTTSVSLNGQIGSDIAYLDGRNLSENSYIKNGRIQITFDEFYLTNSRNLHNDIIYAERRGIKNIDLRMANAGGSVVVLYNVIELIQRAQKDGIYFTAYGELLVASAAVPVFEICDKRIITKNTLMLMHPIQGVEDDPQNGDYKRLVTQWEEMYAEIVADNSDLSKETVLSYMRPTKEVNDWSKPIDGKPGEYEKKRVVDKDAVYIFMGEEVLGLRLADEFGFYGF